MKILFICKHNRFRSKVAEATFAHYSKGRHKAISRGMVKDIPVAKSVVEVMKAEGIKLKDRKSRKVNKKDVKWADLIIITADNVPKPLFKNKKILKWKISDTNQENIKGIKKRVCIIKRKVLNLIKKLNKKV
jgi:protein-tyrosine-phosphatase